MAPEVMIPDRTGYNEKCDVFSYAVILFELATCTVPYTQYNPMAFMQKMIRDKDFREVIPDFVPTEWKYAVLVYYSLMIYVYTYIIT